MKIKYNIIYKSTAGENLYVLFTDYSEKAKSFCCKYYDIETNKIYLRNAFFTEFFINQLRLAEVKENSVKTKLALKGLI